MIKREFPIKTEADVLFIKKINNIYFDGDICVSVLIGEVYEYFGEWESAHEIYSSAIYKFDPIRQSDLNFLLKLKLGLHRCLNLRNYEKPTIVHEYFSL
jgi:hypothetical protein